MLSLTKHIEYLNNNPLDKPYITRFAPSPTGYLHLGHIASSIVLWKLAYGAKAKIIFRFENHDRQRCKEAYEESILDIMQKFGFLDYKKLQLINNPLEDFHRQSDRSKLYYDYYKLLRKKNLLYACVCSRSSLAGKLIYPNICRSKTLKFCSKHNIRYKTTSNNITYNDLRHGIKSELIKKDEGDFIIRDRNKNWSYQYSVVCDDIYDGINLVIRGDDILDSTSKQIQLESSLKENNSQKYYFHHPIITDSSGKKLGKKFHSKPITEYLSEGYSIEAILAKAAFAIGLIPKEQNITLQDLLLLK